MNKSTYKIPLAPPSRATLLSTIQLPPTPLPVRRRCYRNSGWLINRRARNGDPIGLQAYSVEAPQRQARRRWAGFPKEPVECELVGPLLPSHLFFHLLLYLLRLLLYLLLRFLCLLFYLGSFFLYLLFYLGSPFLHLFFYPLLYLLLDWPSARRCAERQYESGRNENGESFPHVFSSSLAGERKSIRAERRIGCEDGPGHRRSSAA